MVIQSIHDVTELWLCACAVLSSGKVVVPSVSAVKLMVSWGCAQADQQTCLGCIRG